LIVGGDDLAEPLRKRTEAIAGAAAVGRNWAQVGATELLTEGLDPFEIVSAALRNRGVEQLTILWSAVEIAEYGLPVDQIERAILLDPDFDGTLLSTICPEVSTGGAALHSLL
jgi:hypothetical protein